MNSRLKVVGMIAATLVGAPACAQTSLQGHKIGEVYATPETTLVRIGREFPAFDTDFSGELDSYEFGKWLRPLVDLRLVYDDAKAGEADIETFIAESFTLADTDSNGEVSDKELANYFIGEVEA